MVMALAALSIAALAAPARAQQTSFDFPPSGLGPGARKAADIASWAAVGANVYLDLNSTIGKCRGQDDCYRALVFAGVRYGAAFGATTILKRLVGRVRPCAPDCGIDNPDYSFPSGHTAFAFAAVGAGGLRLSVPLAVGTGGLRVLAGKHWLTDALAGAAIGLAAGRIR
jgi:membrane-associated phospholipid phosphatase